MVYVFYDMLSTSVVALHSENQLSTWHIMYSGLAIDQAYISKKSSEFTALHCAQLISPNEVEDR